jgi:hypothetical protein
MEQAGRAGEEGLRDGTPTASLEWRGWRVCPAPDPCAVVVFSNYASALEPPVNAIELDDAWKDRFRRTALKRLERGNDPHSAGAHNVRQAIKSREERLDERFAIAVAAARSPSTPRGVF